MATAAVLPDLDVEKVRHFCAKRCPPTLADEVRLEVTTRGKNVSIHECRPVWRGAPGEWTKMPIAQLRYDGSGGWTLYFDLEPSQNVGTIIAELEEDPTCVFWG